MAKDSPTKTNAAQGKYLTFTLADEQYGIGILKVKEIIGTMPITPVPRTPDSIKGVVNLRGKVIPIMDLRTKFGLPSQQHTDRACIVVVELEQPGGSMTTGIIVDSVSEVLNIQGEQIEPAPDFGIESGATDYIVGMAKTDDGVKILMDIDKVLSGTEASALMLDT